MQKNVAIVIFIIYVVVLVAVAFVALLYIRQGALDSWICAA